MAVYERRDTAPKAHPTEGRSRRVALRQPAIATARLAKFGGITVDHMADVQADTDRFDLAERAHLWARDVAAAVDLDVRVRGTTAGNPGALLVANHRSYIDIIAALYATPAFFLAKAEVADWPLLGKAAQKAGTVFVDRDSRSSRSDALRSVEQKLVAGHQVVVFPEGTTHRGPGCQRFRRGVFYAAARANVPVVPIAIEYPDPRMAWVEDDTFLKHFARSFGGDRVEVHVHFGPALHGLEPETMTEAANEWVSTRLLQLRDDVISTSGPSGSRIVWD